MQFIIGAEILPGRHPSAPQDVWKIAGIVARTCIVALVTVLWAAASVAAGGGQTQAKNDKYMAWITAMKTAERGPFSQIRWFCKDGQILPPRPYGCKEFGGGAQHGEWSDRTKTMRDAGYRIANFYSDLDIDAFVRDEARTDAFAQMLIEQFLIRADDGWILRRARFYRGAYQEEGERRGSRKLLFKLAQDPYWLTTRYLQLRTAVRFLAHADETASVQEIRQLSASLSDKDTGFKTLRNKIHGTPEAADAEAVSAYLENVTDEGLRAEYEHLIELINTVYATDVGEILNELADRTAGAGDLATVVGDAAGKLKAAASDEQRFMILANVLAGLRDRITVPNGPRARIAIMDASLVLESELFTVAARMLAGMGGSSRAERLRIATHMLAAIYATGLISKRELTAATGALKGLSKDALTVADYKRALGYLALAPNWSTQALRMYFGQAEVKLAEIEPKAHLFSQDYLRGSPMFFYAQLIDELLRDANRLAGVKNELFGADVGAGLRSLNPGVARGVLGFPPAEGIADLDRDGIYALPETVSELPPVAGILTEGEGNPLSHVQLLARNLGIPNVGVDKRFIPRLREHAGQKVLLAVSSAGSVRLQRYSSEYDAFFDTGGDEAEKKLIKVNVDKLDLGRRDFLTLSQLRATDSGRTVGPKAAKLGELKHFYPEAVAEGLAIPFGTFRALLDRRMPGEDGTVFEWMVAAYDELEAMPADSPERHEKTEALRARLQDWVLNVDPGDEFRARLRARMEEVFGADGSFGVFVRSDTNVEDLPGFTGAGLNLTLPNVVGIDNIFTAISKVWASPFSARSFAWRQALMDKPEHVYPAVLLMLSVDSQKSGVLVTQDIETGDNQWLSVAVNEGVGGAVDGQSAESLRIDTGNAEVILMAQATAPIRRTVDLSGGVDKLPTSGDDYVLRKAEIAQLITLAKELPENFPAIVDSQGRPAPADIEFGFLGGELKLFQIRPFLESDAVRSNALLRELDAPLAANAANPVDLDAAPSAK